MIQKRWFMILLAVAILGVLVVPKDVYRQEESSIISCSCIGLASESQCYGISYSCTSYEQDISGKINERSPASIDIILAIDVSESMRGERFSQAKEAAKSFISQMSHDDRMALIAFSDDAETVIGFTSEHSILYSKIEGLDVAQKKTNYGPALDLAYDSFRDSDGVKKLIFISDGEPSDESDATYSSVERLGEQDICLYTVGYGDNDGDWAQVLENMADMSYHTTSCGSFHRSDEGWIELSGIFETIYHDTSKTELEVTLNSPKADVYDSTDIIINISTNVPAQCSYTLNDGNLADINSYVFRTQAASGENRISVYCKKRFQQGNPKVVDTTFFVSEDRSIFGQLKRQLVPKQEIRQPSADEFIGLLEEIVEKQDVSFMMDAVYKGKGTVIYLMIQNNKPVTLSNLLISQVIQKDLVIHPNRIESEYPFTMVATNPVVIEFGQATLEPEQIMTITYYIDNKLTKDDVAKIQTEITFDPIMSSEIKALVSDMNQTYFEMSRSSSGREGAVTLKPISQLDDVYVYLSIPKCMAYSINKIHLKDTNYKVISDDPLIMWRFDEVSDDVSIEYQLSDEMAEACEDQIRVLASASNVEQETLSDEGRGLAFFQFLPLLVIPFIVFFLIFQNRFATESSSSTLKYVALGIALLLILWFIFPKDSVQGEKSCECFGVRVDDTCYGSNYNCYIPTGIAETFSRSQAERCDMDCTSLAKYLKTDPQEMSEQGIDLSLIIDQSRSMENEKMANAKNAAVSFLSQLKDYDRIAIFKFDNSSDLVQQFTSDRQAATDSINRIDIGYKTEYLPVLRNAYYNYLSEGRRFSRWMVIFISDGEPDDSGDRIYDFVEEMANDGICVSTIGFGKEITPGSKSEEILMGMAQKSREITSCGSYYYSPKDIETLIYILGRAYEESAAHVGLQIEARPESLELNELEDLVLEAKVRSNINRLLVPGSFKMGSEQVCTTPAKMDLTLFGPDGTELKQYPFKYDSGSGQYYLSVNGLPLGTFTADIHAQAGIEPGCVYEGNLELGQLSVTEFEGFTKCQTNTCDEVKQYLFSNLTRRIENVLITDYAFIPQNVSITDGTLVIWKNIGKQAHTVTSGSTYYDGHFNSGKIYPGDSFNFTFKKGGAFMYFDNLSVRMKAGTFNVSRNITVGEFKLEYKKPIDLALVIDSSASMTGEKLSTVKNAANKLIEMIYPGDRIALMKFSEGVKVLQDFTGNRNLLHVMVGDIVPAGSTRYVPALEKVGELFDRRDSQDSGKVVIFLSDGIPWDEGKPDSIYGKVQKLIDEGVCIFTVGYGDEITPGSEAEVLLQKIVSMSQESSECGKYNYAPANEIELARIFGSIYYDAIGSMKGLTVTSDISREAILDNETVTVRAKVRSAFNNNYLPGFVNNSFFEVCGPEANVQAVVYDSRNRSIVTKDLRYMGESTGYQAEIGGLAKGQYNVVVQATGESTDGECCGFSGQDENQLIVISAEPYTVHKGFLALLLAIIAILSYLVFKRR